MSMSLHIRHSIGISVGAALISAAACGGSSPTSPGPAGTSGSGGGATISGVVSGSAPTAGLTVRVVGTPLSSMVDSAGAFRVTAVPPGEQVRLQFVNNAVDATAAVPNVAASDVIQLRVQLTNTSAVVVSDERANQVSLCHTEGNGTYHMISVAPEAEPAHRAHGDGKVGDPVPGRSPMVFAADCRLLGPAVTIEKSTNGADADSAPGPSIVVGSPVTWEYRVSNTGTTPLTSIVVDDDQGVTVSCGASTLTPGASMTCTGSGVATLGQYRNVGRVTASYTMGTASGTVTDSDASHYLGISPTVEGLKVTLCHKTGNGSYHAITVSVDAEPAHRAHGDAKVGEAVPGQAGKVFGATCQVQ